MPSTLELRRRIRSIKSTKQITKAMEMVSTAKTRRASQASQASRPYAIRLWEVVRDLTQVGGEDSHPLLSGMKDAQAKTLAIVIASDRGLAGSYNGSVLKAALALESEEVQAGRAISFIAIGKKAESGLVRRGKDLLQSYLKMPDRPALADIAPIAGAALAEFKAGRVGRVVVVYTDFRSMLAQEVRCQQLIPLQAPDDLTAPDARPRFSYEPSPEEVLRDILPRIVEDELYQQVLESVASEHAARRVAMKSATDNASDIIEDLNLTYNSVRQGAITQELAEIAGGAAALS